VGVNRQSSDCDTPREKQLGRRKGWRSKWKLQVFMVIYLWLWAARKEGETAGWTFELREARYTTGEGRENRKFLDVPAVVLGKKMR